MRHYTLLFLLIFSALALSYCSGRLVRKDELNYLHQKYSGEYTIAKKIDVGNNEYIHPGQAVRLYFKSDSESIKVYAYPASQYRESAIGKNIIYLFEEDFPDEEYSRKLFEKKLQSKINFSDKSGKNN